MRFRIRVGHPVRLSQNYDLDTNIFNNLSKERLSLENFRIFPESWRVLFTFFWRGESWKLSSFWELSYQTLHWIFFWKKFMHFGIEIAIFRFFFSFFLQITVKLRKNYKICFVVKSLWSIFGELSTPCLWRVFWEIFRNSPVFHGFSIMSGEWKCLELTITINVF